ncbi:SCO family protein [Seonamhaeicola aphaedonensis]|uniref:SCO1/SenC family protein n=1 Tax=Seonamhaeicola aphaedonensis TaxID=1461338 RepID=A0A3D9HG29_9FLAO|nr:SCO family protein [Seonamhaeicola aphaedonensis]RED48433.1 SCO1/SenC family protein [Seonamhaeicola aphaedonensis]
MQTKRLILVLIMLLLDSCSSKTKLPILSKYINDDGLEVIYKINDLNFTYQNNQNFNENEVNNNVYIANFFFTRCPSICPKMKFVIEDIANDFKKDSNFKIISISIYPKNDTPSVLKLYSNATNIASNKWLFLTGEKKNLNIQPNYLEQAFHAKKIEWIFTTHHLSL